MSRPYLPWFCVGLIAVVCLASIGAGPREDQWKKVNQAVEKGLPKTAIEHLEPIIAGAIRDKAYPEAIRAIAKKAALTGTIEGNKPEEKIVRLEAEIEKAPAEMRPMMTAVLAHWYWHFFQQNRWRFMQRTATAQSPGSDINTWDLPRILAEIDKQFTKALEAEEELKKIPVAEYDELLVKGNMPDSYRPTLFDFVAFEALQFYSSGEQAGSKAEDAFELSADGPAFAPAADFLKWKIETTDENSLTVKALRLYQKVMKFHEDDKTPDALLDADLGRLAFAHSKAVGEEKDARYKAALQRFVDRHGDHPVSALARHYWASVLHGEGDWVEARRIAQQGANAFPRTPGGNLCFNLVQQIEQPELAVVADRVWNSPWPALDVRYRNIKEVHFRLVARDWKTWITKYDPGARWLDEASMKAALSDAPVKQWSAQLPATEDFQQRSEEVAVPQDLKPGWYFLVASVRPDFSQKDNIILFRAVWVSKLGLVLRTRSGEATIEGFVLDNESGEPIAGADVQVFINDNRRDGYGPAGQSVKTDQNGLFRAAGQHQRSAVVLVSHGDQKLANEDDLYLYQGGGRQRRAEQTVFFTDRSLYRPGQTIQYKGICVAIDHERDEYSAVAHRDLTVVFVDPNGKEIAKQKQRTNQFGSFSGSFTAPRDRLMGRMQIRVESGPPGGTGFNVEEYKRPKFQVELDAPKTPAKLNETVQITGKATAYTGAAIGGAKVRYRVVREVRYPDWWYWLCWWMPRGGNSQEIAHGSTTTESDGSFKIEFVAKPDLSVSEKDEPVFQYSVTAEVTDTTGETRVGDRTVNVAYTALRASMSAPQWLTAEKPVEVTISTTTHDGEGQKAEGAVKIYALKQPAKVQRPKAQGVHVPRFEGRGKAAKNPPPPDPADINSWELGDLAAEEGFTTAATGQTVIKVTLKPGPYRVMLETQDRYNKPIKAVLPLLVLDPNARALPVKLPNLVAAPKWALEPGEEFMALWGSGYEKARAFIEVEHRRKVIQAFWTEQGASQQKVVQKVDEAMRGGFTVRVTMVRENRGYVSSHYVSVPWSNKQLSIAWERFVSKLEPAQKETFTAIITGPDAKKAAAEMVATLYDKSLDAYLPHNWPGFGGLFRSDYTNLNAQFQNTSQWLNQIAYSLHREYRDGSIKYRQFPPELTANLWGYQFGRRAAMLRGGFGGMGGMAADGAAMPAAAAPMADRLEMQAAGAPMEGGEREQAKLEEEKNGVADKRALRKAGNADPGRPDAGPDLSKVAARTNLNETAFFFPHLISGEDGTVRMEFTMPEALTTWKLIGFAHDEKLRSGMIGGEVITAKDLMCQPNPPRFLREGDVLAFSVKVSNQSAGRLAGKVRLTFFDPVSEKPLDAALGNSAVDQAFDIASKESASFTWQITVPDGMGPVAYKAVAASDRLSDGEQAMLPVLSRRVLVTESLPLPIRGPQTKKFTFARLADSGKSDTLQHQTLTVQMVSNPSWYAVMALPYLMEYPYECSEQVFNRLYANSLARHIALSSPRIRRVFDQWRDTPALDSPLEKNQDLKAVMLEETPWLRQAQAESQARRNVGILFDDNRLNEETGRLLAKLAEMQHEDGAWPWFPGGPGNDYITLYITTGFGRLRHLGVKLDAAPAIKSLTRLDGWIDRTYREILRHGHKDKNNLSTTIALYLYGRSFFLENKPIAAEHREAVDYFLGQAKAHWLKLDVRQSQAHLAVALKRFGDIETARDIMRSIKERSVSNEEMGMFWRDLELSWWWYRAPIETQAMMIEAFDEVMNDAQAVEECKVWLLKQKQTQDWKTTKATADAIYALLLRGENLLAADALVEVALGGRTIKPEKVEAGTGFYEQRFVRGEIQPKMAEVTVKKTDPGVAWGSVHWQYLEDMSKVTAFEGTPLKITKNLFVREYAKTGPVLKPIAGTVKVGDEIVVRLVLRTDRDMEYVHLKDYRGSGTEPVNVLSRYKYQDGLGYYESTRDTASHFFIDYLPKGTYVFEYAVRVVHKGKYQTGFAAIQCMYAPEFNSHSESIVLQVE